MFKHEETLELIKLAQKGDESAKEKLVTDNSPLIKSVIKFYKNKGVEYDDLYQLGCLGFLKAINNFDVSFNVKFSTYAVPMVAGEVKRFMRDDGSIKVSRALKSLYIKINKYINEYRQEFDMSPTVEEISIKFDIEESEIVFAMDSGKALISLDEKFNEDNSRDKPLSETIITEETSEKIINNLFVKDILKNLPKRDKQILLMRFFHDKTQTEIANELGVSQVQISRLENKILEKIKTKYGN